MHPKFEKEFSEIEHQRTIGFNLDRKDFEKKLERERKELDEKDELLKKFTHTVGDLSEFDHISMIKIIPTKTIELCMESAEAYRNLVDKLHSISSISFTERKRRSYLERPSDYVTECWFGDYETLFVLSPNDGPKYRYRNAIMTMANARSKRLDYIVEATKLERDAALVEFDRLD